MQCYTGIGSRKSPYEALVVMRHVAHTLATKGLLLRSGGAEGADMAFEGGCDEARGTKQIYLPWKRFNKNPSPFYEQSEAAMQMAQKFHPAWHMCTPGAKKMHARNCYQVLGEDLKSPSLFVLCWTWEDKGGTLQAVRIADANNIPVYNLKADGNCDYNKVMEFCNGILENAVAQ